MLLYLVGFTAILVWFVKYLYNMCFRKEDELVYSEGYEEQWFGRGASPSQDISEIDSAVHPFKIQVSDEVLADLKSRIEKTRFEESLEEANFEYGFHSSYLYEVVNYWKNQYDWRKQEKYLNQYPHFKTPIEGIDVHFVHVKPTVHAGKNVIPILLIHGWPGSFYEFFKMIPMMTTIRDNQNFVFEMICPSIPGYGFSESPHHRGFNQRAAARIFVTLMTRLGHTRFYVQGGDWGSLISQLIAQLYPNKVIGVHSNMFMMRFNFCNVIKYTLAHFLTFLVTPQEYKVGFPFKKIKRILLEESGYYHIQATKPDTIGTSLADSPVGLAAYILEKFSTWTDSTNICLPDGGLTKKFTLDELLTNVMIYWINNNIKASQTFYKEDVSDPYRVIYAKIPITVPLGVAFFPNELFLTPKIFITKKLVHNLVSFTFMPKGGHFAAFEEPQLLAEDVWKFVELTEKGSEKSHKRTNFKISFHFS